MIVTDPRFLQRPNLEKGFDFDFKKKGNNSTVGSLFCGKESNVHVAMRLAYPKFCELLLKTLKNYN